MTLVDMKVSPNAIYCDTLYTGKGGVFMNEQIITAMDIANLLIQNSIIRGTKLSNLRLQKILYLIQASFLQRFNQQLFPDTFEAWTYGPVIPSVYHAFKHNGSNTISKTLSDDESETLELLLSNSEIMETVTFVEDTYTGVDDFGLVEVTHTYGPWKKYYSPYRNFEIPTNDLVSIFDEIVVV